MKGAGQMAPAGATKNKRILLPEIHKSIGGGTTDRRKGSFCWWLVCVTETINKVVGKQLRPKNCGGLTAGGVREEGLRCETDSS